MCRRDFVAFFFLIFREAIEAIDGVFVPARHLIEWGYRLQDNNRTATVSARFHLKSTAAIAYIAWQLYKLDRRYSEWELMCYKADLGEYHLKRLKRYIGALPVFAEYKELTDATSRLHYAKEGMEFVAIPSGILSFNRGRHPDGLICDDILRDPTTVLDLTQLKKIESIFFEDVEPMPKEQLHVFGTPQHQADLFHSLSKKAAYNTDLYPAISDFGRHQTLWPQKYDYDWLMAYKQRVGDKAFNKEMMCRPVHSEEGFLNQETIERISLSRLRNYSAGKGKPKLKAASYAGFDIGKKTHPSHLCVLAIDRAKRLVQIHSKWMDGWDYVDQVAYIDQAIKQFGVCRLYYDDTRAEFESFNEAGSLPAEMQPLVFTARDKFALAGGIDRLLTQQKLWLLRDERQMAQLLNVDNELKSVETAEGHADCFWSLALAVKAAEEGSAQLIWDF